MPLICSDTLQLKQMTNTRLKRKRRRKSQKRKEKRKKNSSKAHISSNKPQIKLK
jgi:hypothetical protein